MAEWTADAKKQFEQIKAQLKKWVESRPGEMESLKTKVEAWANNNPNGITEIPFGQFSRSRVQVQTKDGKITHVDYGEN